MNLLDCQKFNSIQKTVKCLVALTNFFSAYLKQEIPLFSHPVFSRFDAVDVPGDETVDDHVGHEHSPDGAHRQRV
jgi:hypothetical protein